VSAAPDDDQSLFVNKLQNRAESEKTALARRIHDELGSYLLAASMDLSSLKQKLASADEGSLRRLERIARLLHAAIDMARAVTEDLHPTLLDNVGLFAALRREMQAMCARSKVRCIEHFPEIEPRLSPAAGIALFRLGQETLMVAESLPGVTVIDFLITVDAVLLRMHISTDADLSAPTADTRAAEAWASAQLRAQALGGRAYIARSDYAAASLEIEVPLAHTRSPPMLDG
jgi:signal transduction histidine kinase